MPEAVGGAARPVFLLEIGVEELPARMCPDALEQLRARGEELLRGQRLPFAASRCLGTPRRLAWMVDGLADRQEDAEVVARGPARAAAFDAEGRPTAAAQGFARAQGVPVESLTVEAAGRREYVFARRTEVGRPSAEVLGRLLPDLVGGLQFPRAMRWGSGDFRFPRPIRWIVALLGGEVVPCRVAGLQAGQGTQGHRTLHPGTVDLRRAEDYVETLRGAGVMVDRDERRARIRDGAAAAASALGARVRFDEDLLAEVTDINEWPTAFVGGFDPGALALPEAVLVTVMRVHQRYFPVEDGAGALLPHFLGVRNGGGRNLEGVAAGNERVLAARFADARFFYDEDVREPLGSRVERLDTIVFADGLGTMAEKTRRLEALCAALSPPLGADSAVVARAARLCKADRLTRLGYELPELEGTIGGHYAARDGEPEAVAAAVAEHVLPRGAGDALPSTPAGAVLALADRLDTLAGNFLLGRQPTGSTDPLGLRRAALAVVRIIESAGWDLSLRGAAGRAVAGYPPLGGGLDPERALGDLLAFLRGRLEGRLAEMGHRPDLVDAVLAAGADRVVDAIRRCDAVSAALRGPGWQDTVTAFKRAGNLARQGEAGVDVDPGLFTHAAEASLWQALARARREAAAALAAGDHAGVLAATASLRQPVDDFLRDVLAMDPDPNVRRNRLALLAGVAAVPAPVAELGRLAG